MKGIFKFFVIVVIMNLIGGVSFLGYMAFSLVSPSFEETGITLSDLYQKHLSPEKYALLQQNLEKRSSQLGKESAQKLVEGFKVIFPLKPYDVSKMPKIEYPYPSSDEIMKMNNSNVQKGIEQGLKNLEDMEKNNQAIREATLNQ